MTFTILCQKRHFNCNEQSSAEHNYPLLFFRKSLKLKACVQYGDPNCLEKENGEGNGGSGSNENGESGSNENGGNGNGNGNGQANGHGNGNGNGNRNGNGQANGRGNNMIIPIGADFDFFYTESCEARCKFVYRTSDFI